MSKVAKNLSYGIRQPDGRRAKPTRISRALVGFSTPWIDGYYYLVVYY
jgi:hypothetical protein